jgi:hypothetical protein
MNCREAIEIAERRCDGLANDEEWALAREVGHGAEWFAESDTFGFDPVRFIGSEVRYAAANAILQATQESFPDDRRPLFGYRRYLERSSEEVHPGHDGAICDLVRDLYGNPYRPVVVRRDWVVDAVSDLARTIYEERAFDLMPILGDALESSGCSDGVIVRHCHKVRLHARGCWVVDQILKREWLAPLRRR